jgi:hypothetical protein
MRICTKHIEVEVILYCNSQNCLIQSRIKIGYWGLPAGSTFLWILICFNVRSNNFKLSLIYQKPKCSNDFISRFVHSFWIAKILTSTLEFRESTIAALLSMRPCKLYLTSRFRYLLFFNLTLKTKTAAANGWETTRYLANHLDQSLWLPIRNKEQQSDHIYYILLYQVLGFVVPSISLNKLYKNAGSKLFFAEPNQYVFTFLHPILIYRVLNQILPNRFH